jgi:hypothetical protein
MTTTDLDRIDAAIAELAAALRDCVERIVDAYLAVLAEDETAPVPAVLADRPDTRQTLVADLQAGDTVLFGRNDPDEIIAVAHGRDGFSRVRFASAVGHNWTSDETVPVLLVDCPACGGHGFGRNCGCCAGAGRVTGGTARTWRMERDRRLSMEEADIA